MTVDVTVLGEGDAGVLRRVATGVFDRTPRPELIDDFLSDPRHHIAVAVDDGRVVGFASAVHYVHPDKPAELWVNETGVAPSYRGRGLGSRLLETLLEVGTTLGCSGAWVLTERANGPARRLYEAAGGVEAEEDTIMYEFHLS